MSNGYPRSGDAPGEPGPARNQPGPAGAYPVHTGDQPFGPGPVPRRGVGPMGPQRPNRQPRMTPALVVAVVVFVVVVTGVVVGVFLRSHNHGQSAGAQQVADRYASGLANHDRGDLDSLTCNHQAERTAVNIMPEVVTASVQHLTTTGNVAHAQLQITADLKWVSPGHSANDPGQSHVSRTTFPGTVNLRKPGGSGKSWCVQKFDAAVPAF